MRVEVHETVASMAEAAAAEAVRRLRAALADRGEANLVLATGASQLQLLERLRAAPDIAWSRVTGFHLDEYVGLPIEHSASFRRYLWERFVSRLPLPLRAFHYIDGESDPQAECERLNAVLAAHPVDLALVGIGENGHLAFNDPPADFETEAPFLVVELDEACRRQQLGEGWFPSLADVPRTAISMSIRQILKSRAIVCIVPDARKARPVRDALEGVVTPQVPASILQRHPDCSVFLDRPAASLLERTPAT